MYDILCYFNGNYNRLRQTVIRKITSNGIIEHHVPLPQCNSCSSNVQMLIFQEISSNRNYTDNENENKVKELRKVKTYSFNSVKMCE